MEPLVEKMLNTLLAKARHRTDYRQLPDPERVCGNTALAWELAERQAMLDAVNAERQARELPQLALSDIARCERLAIGHCDYAQKMALYCAWLAEGHPERVRG